MSLGYTFIYANQNQGAKDIKYNSLYLSHCLRTIKQSDSKVEPPPTRAPTDKKQRKYKYQVHASRGKKPYRIGR